jgi:hypothetical protein
MNDDPSRVSHVSVLPMSRIGRHTPMLLVVLQ